MQKVSLIVVTAMLLAGCASTSVTPVSRNQILLNTSASPARGASGAEKVAAQMAAVETVRRGFDRFVIVGAGSENNVSVINSGPRYAMTYGTFNTFGDTTYGNSTTTFGGSTPIITGTRDRTLNVLMLNPGDEGFSQGVDAKAALGSDWQTLVEEGVSTCA